MDGLSLLPGLVELLGHPSTWPTWFYAIVMLGTVVSWVPGGRRLVEQVVSLASSWVRIARPTPIDLNTMLGAVNNIRFALADLAHTDELSRVVVVQALRRDEDWIVKVWFEHVGISGKPVAFVWDGIDVDPAYRSQVLEPIIKSTDPVTLNFEDLIPGSQLRNLYEDEGVQSSLIGLLATRADDHGQIGEVWYLSANRTSEEALPNFEAGFFRSAQAKIRRALRVLMQLRMPDVV